MAGDIVPGSLRRDRAPARPGAPCVRCATLPRPGAQYCDRCGAVLGFFATPVAPIVAAPQLPVRPAIAPLIYPVRERERPQPGPFRTGFGFSLGWMFGRLAFQLLMFAILAFIAVALVGPLLGALRVL